MIRQTAPHVAMPPDARIPGMTTLDFPTIAAIGLLLNIGLAAGFSLILLVLDITGSFTSAAMIDTVIGVPVCIALVHARSLVSLGWLTQSPTFTRRSIGSGCSVSDIQS